MRQNQDFPDVAQNIDSERCKEDGNFSTCKAALHYLYVETAKEIVEFRWITWQMDLGSAELTGFYKAFRL